MGRRSAIRDGIGDRCRWQVSAQAIRCRLRAAMTQESGRAGDRAGRPARRKNNWRKLFEVMRIQDQMQSMRKIVPTLIENRSARTDARR